ncbi:MAG: SPOR domain-containing protein [Acidobacteria bacterium]|nr:SPOR domain-containing protein [Acidobacteriota bacterium]
MIRDFSREELEPAGSNHTELTLGIGMVLGLGAGLLLLCIVCFALGYAVGHRSSANQDAAVVIPNSNSATLTAKTGTKPGATRQAVSPSSPDATVSGTDATKSSTGISQDGSSQPATAQSDVPIRVQPATSQVQGWMVQIAAVSHTEDADVLVGALRKRGYSVTERRELGDNLIHVQTGPFTSRNDANAMRQKLLSDGYNAIVQ